MGAISFSLDLQLFSFFQKHLPLDVFVETGTFKGDTLAEVLPLVRQAYSVELSEAYYRQARERFASHANVHLHHASSPNFLLQIRDSLQEQSVFYWLDAHWCVDDNVPEEESQCPLIEELKAIELNSRSIVVIDDARLFTAPPPKPHKINDWPTFHQITGLLLQRFPSHLVNIYNDCLVIYPKSLEDRARNYFAEFGMNLLDMRYHAERATLYLKEMNEKEVVIRDQGGHIAILEKALAASRDQCQALEENARKQQILLSEKNDTISTLEKRLTEIKTALVRSESHTRHLQLALDHLSAKSLAWFFIPLCALVSCWRFLQKKLFEYQDCTHRVISRRLAHWERWHAYQLGKFHQHPPRPMHEESFPRPSLSETELPSIAIVTPTYNMGNFLEDTLRSVLSQKYPKLQYVIQDGGSRDQTPEILARYRHRLHACESAPDKGQADAIHKGMEKTDADIMAWLNADDLLTPGSLRYVGEFFARNPEIDVVYGHRLVIDEQNCEIGRWYLPSHRDEDLYYVDYVPQETLFWRRSLWQRAGGVDTSFQFAMDWDLILRFIQHDARIVRLPYFIGCFRIHTKQKTSARINDIGEKEMHLLRERTHGYPVSQQLANAAARKMIGRSRRYKLRKLLGLSP